jgi:hypothetical protein
MPTQNYIPEENNGKRTLRIVLWFVVGACLLAVLCCVGTVVGGWFFGDWIIEIEMLSGR